MSRMKAMRMAAWGAILAMALHALSPLAAPAPRAGGGLHDICTSGPTAPQPVGDPSTSHCALCVVSASISSPPVILGVFAADVLSPAFLTEQPADIRPPHPASPPRAPPAGA
jgi:hypothetical protein